MDRLHLHKPAWVDLLNTFKHPQVVFMYTCNSVFLTGTKAPQKVLFVEDLTKMLIDHLPDLVRLGQAYLTGKLVKQVCLVENMNH